MKKKDLTSEGEHFANRIIKGWATDVFLSYALGWISGVCLMVFSLMLLLEVML